MIVKRGNNILKLVMGGLFAAFITVATMLIQIPTPTRGYINLGDAGVNIAAWILGPVYGAGAAGIGSALADLFAGYSVYAPATFVIKALMAVAAAVSFDRINKKVGSFAGRIIASVAAEIVMIAGYALFEAVLYGSAAAALTGIPSNAVQGLGGIIISVTVYEVLIARLPLEKYGLR